MGKTLGLLERIELIIPGFHGYKQKELIREDDKLVRNKVASLLDDARKAVEKLMPMLLNTSPVAVIKLDNLRKDLMMVSQKIRHASYGYSGLFDRIKIRENELNTLLQYDWNLISKANEIRDETYFLFKIINNEQQLLTKIDELSIKLFELDGLVDQRERLLKEEG